MRNGGFQSPRRRGARCSDAEIPVPEWGGPKFQSPRRRGARCSGAIAGRARHRAAHVSVPSSSGLSLLGLAPATRVPSRRGGFSPLVVGALVARWPGMPGTHSRRRCFSPLVVGALVARSCRSGHLMVSYSRVSSPLVVGALVARRWSEGSGPGLRSTVSSPLVVGALVARA